jgi:hypothetical protein
MFKVENVLYIFSLYCAGSILSDFSYSRSEDDLDGSVMQAGKAWKKHRPSTGGVPEPAPKKRRSSGAKAVEVKICQNAFLQYSIFYVFLIFPLLDWPKRHCQSDHDFNHVQGRSNHSNVHHRVGPQNAGTPRIHFDQRKLCNI